MQYFKSWQYLLQYFAILHFVLHNAITIIPFTLVNSLRMFAILQVLAISLAVLCKFVFVLHHAITLHNASFNFKALHYLAYFEKLQRIAFLCVSIAILSIIYNSLCYNSQIYVLAYTIVSNGLQWAKVGTTSRFALFLAILCTIALIIAFCITLQHATYNCTVFLHSVLQYLLYFTLLH